MPILPWKYSDKQVNQAIGRKVDAAKVVAGRAFGRVKRSTPGRAVRKLDAKILASSTRTNARLTPGSARKAQLLKAVGQRHALQTTRSKVHVARSLDRKATNAYYSGYSTGKVAKNISLFRSGTRAIRRGYGSNHTKAVLSKASPTNQRGIVAKYIRKHRNTARFHNKLYNHMNNTDRAYDDAVINHRQQRSSYTKLPSRKPRGSRG